MSKQIIHFKNKNFNCEFCGKETKRSSSTQKYCHDCAEKISHLKCEKNYKEIYKIKTRNPPSDYGFFDCVKCGKKNIKKLSSRHKYCDECRKIVERNHDHAYRLAYLRERVLQNGKVQTRVLKRPYPEDNACEVCHKIKHLAYHHYGEIIEGKFINGIWVCITCHHKAEVLDRPEILENFAKIYLPIKEYLLKTGKPNMIPLKLRFGRLKK